MPTINIKSNHKLAGLIVLSATLHIFGFYLLNSETSLPLYQPLITAKIVYPSTKDNNNKVTNKQNKTIVSKEKPHTVTKTTKTESTTTDNIPANSSATNKPEKSISWYQVETRIKTEFRQHFYYPKMAVRNGWQGRVLLSLTILQTGTVSEYKVIETSGYSVLDQAALSSLEKIKHINMNPQKKFHDPVYIEFPVIFKLSKG